MNFDDLDKPRLTERSGRMSDLQESDIQDRVSAQEEFTSGKDVLVLVSHRSISMVGEEEKKHEVEEIKEEVEEEIEEFNNIHRETTQVELIPPEELAVEFAAQSAYRNI